MKVIIVVGAAAIAAAAFWAGKLVDQYQSASYYQAVAAQTYQAAGASAPVSPAWANDNLTQQAMQHMHDHILAGEIAGSK